MRNDHMQKFIDRMTEELFGRSESEAREKGVCVMCEKEIGEFKDELSVKEYNISGLCQSCQDEIFDVERMEEK